MILVGSLTFSTGVLLSLVGGVLWYQNALWRVPFDEGRVRFQEWEPDPKPATRLTRALPLGLRQGHRGHGHRDRGATPDDEG